MRPDEDFLREVLRIMMISVQVECEVVDPSLVCFDKLPKGLPTGSFTAGRVVSHQLSVSRSDMMDSERMVFVYNAAWETSALNEFDSMIANRVPARP